MPSILHNETLLYAQAFAAVNHINFINPKAYKAECYVLKGHAIHKINEKLNDPDEAACDANIGAVLCMASAAHLEVRFPSSGIFLDQKTKKHNFVIILDLTITNSWNTELRGKQLHDPYTWSPEDGGHERRHADLAREPIVT